MSETAPAPPIRSRLTVLVREDAERFDGPDSMMRLVTPEAMNSFQRIDIQIESANLSAHVSFVPRASTRDRAGVELAVSTTDPDRREEVVAVARIVALSVRRGFRRYLGTTSGSAGVGTAFRGKAVRASRVIAHLAPYVLGAAIFLLVYWAKHVFFPHAHVPDAAYGLLVVATGAGFPSAWSYWLPDVEIARQGRTRLRSTVTRTSQAVVAIVLTTLVKALIHAG